MTPKLAAFRNDLNSKDENITCEQWFTSLAYRLMNDLCLMVGNSRYRITECELYYHGDGHKDVYIHGEDPQLEMGHLYLNKAGGLDITFGNKEKKIHGGILIRGIRNLETKKYINKITHITNEIFLALGNIVEGKRCICLLEAAPEDYKPEQPIQSTRVGLKRKDQDKDNYFEKPYRYIVELTPEHKFAEKENVLRKLLTEKKISSDEVRNALSYSLKKV